jgi:hypothetical protein
MKRTWTIIGVKDVPRSFRWYQSLFGRPARPPGVARDDLLVLGAGQEWRPETEPLDALGDLWTTIRLSSLPLSGYSGRAGHDTFAMSALYQRMPIDTTLA